MPLPTVMLPRTASELTTTGSIDELTENGLSEDAVPFVHTKGPRESVGIPFKLPTH